eukprot:11294175-Karenia_brevis.AAC.1
MLTWDSFLKFVALCRLAILGYVVLCICVIIKTFTTQILAITNAVSMTATQVAGNNIGIYAVNNWIGPMIWGPVMTTAPAP